MRNTNFFIPGNTITMINNTDEKGILYKYTYLDGIEKLVFPEIKSIGNFFKIEFETEKENHFLFFVWGNNVEICRIGSPEILIIAYTGKTGETHTFKQLSIENGDILDEGILDEIDFGFYFIKPKNLITSFFEIDKINLITLVIPYKDISKNIINCPNSIIINNLNQEFIEKSKNLDVKIILKNFIFSNINENESLNAEIEDNKLKAYIDEKNYFVNTIYEKEKI